jgi:hypothetical protein
MSTAPSSMVKTNRDAIINAINLICEHRDAATRLHISSISGLRRQIVDDHLKTLKTEGLIRMVMAGWYAPVDQEPDRPVSTTNLPCGRIKIEVGDDVVDLNPREAFNLAKQLAGLFLAFRAGV